MHICKRCNRHVVTTEVKLPYPGKADEEELERLIQNGDDDGNDDLNEEDSEKQVAIQVKKVFRFLGIIDEPGHGQFRQAIENIDNNADALHEMISSFMASIKKLKGASNVIALADTHVIPMVKIVISTFGSAYAGGVVNLVSHAFDSWIGGIFEMCKDVVDRMCADIQMALCNSALYDDEERHLKSLAASYFRKLYNTLLIEQYADKNVPLRVVNFLSEKLRASQIEVSCTCNEVISFLELHEQVSKLKASKS